MKIFISYAEDDFESFKIDLIAEKLESFTEIEHVYYWRRDCSKSIPEYMEDGIINSDKVIVICSENSYNSKAVQQETNLACYKGRDIVPVFRSFSYVRDLIQPEMGIAFDDENFGKFIEKLYKRISSDDVRSRIINLTKIEYALKREEQNENSFLEYLEKGIDPLWIDFERGYIIRRKEVDDIIQKLNANPKHLIIGGPASGKSSLIKYIGYELCKKEDYDLFLIELDPGKDSLDVIGVLNELLKIRKEKTLVIIDDFHRGLTEKGEIKCNQLIRGIGKNHRYKILISGRDTIPLTYLKYKSELQILKKNEETCTKLFAFDFAESVINHFEDNSNVSLKLEEKQKFKEIYGYDLWVLSLALSLYDPSEGVTEEKKILKKVKQKIELFHSLKKINAADVFLPLSVLFKYEIAVPIDLLKDKFMIDKESIDKLVDEGEIIKKHDNLLLRHSSRARIYTKVYEVYKKLGKNVKEIIQKDFRNWENGIIHIYFQSKPENCIAFLSRLSSFYKTRLTNEDVISELMDNIDTRKAIINRLNDGMRENPRLTSLLKRIRVVAHLPFTKAYLNSFTKTELRQIFNNSKLNQIGNFIAGHKVFYSENLNSVFFDLFIHDFISLKVRDASLEEIRVFTNFVVIKDKEVTFGPPECRFTGKDIARKVFSELKMLDNIIEKVKNSTLKTINGMIVNAFNSNYDLEFIIEKIKSSPSILREKLNAAELSDINSFIYNVDKGAISKEPESNSTFIVNEIVGMEQQLFIPKIKESGLQQFNYLIINFKRNKTQSLSYLTNILGNIDFYELLNKSHLEEIVYFFIHMFIIEELKYFKDEKIKDMLILRLHDKKNNVGDRLALVGIFELSHHSFIKEYIQICDDIEELSKWFESHTNPLEFHPARVVLALTGLKAVDNTIYVTFCYSSLNLNRVINGLNKAEPKSDKIEQIINRFFIDLQELAKDKTRLMR